MRGASPWRETWPLVPVTHGRWAGCGQTLKTPLCSLVSTPRACSGHAMGTPRACSGHHPSTSSSPTAGGDSTLPPPVPSPGGGELGDSGTRRSPCSASGWILSPDQGHSQLSLARMLPSASHRDPRGAGGPQNRGAKSPHGGAGVAEPARASRRCSAIRRQSRQGRRGHGVGHVPVPPVTWPQGGQNCPEPRQRILPPADAGGTVPGRGHVPGAPLTLAHIWPRHTSGERSAPSPSCPASPPPAPGRAGMPPAGGTDRVLVPRLDGRPGLTWCPGTVQGGESQEGQRQLPHGCLRGGRSAGDCERGSTAGLYMRPFPLAPADSSNRLLALGAVGSAASGSVSRGKREGALPGEPAARCRSPLQPGKLEGLFLQSC